MAVPSARAAMKNPGFRCPHSSPGPWRGNPLRVKQRGHQEFRLRPPEKLTHVSAARENAEAEAKRLVARMGKDNRVCARKGPPSQRRGCLHGRKGGSCNQMEPDRCGNSGLRAKSARNLTQNATKKWAGSWRHTSLRKYASFAAMICGLTSRHVCELRMRVGFALSGAAAPASGGWSGSDA